MSFSKMVNFLQEMNKERIVLVKCGAFYIAKGRDAVFLSDTLNLKVICMESGVCKIGIPINSLDKYLKQLDKLNYGYIVYNYLNKENRIEEMVKKDGKSHNEIEENKNCIFYCKKIHSEEDKYMEVLRKFYEERRKRNY